MKCPQCYNVAQRVSRFADVASGALAGGVAGSVVPVVGTIFGALAGSFAGDKFGKHIYGEEKFKCPSCGHAFIARVQ